MMRKKSSTKNRVEENTVKIGRFVARIIIAAFLLGAITIIGIPAANTALNGKVRIISNFINFLSMGIKFQATANFTLQN